MGDFYIINKTEFIFLCKCTNIDFAQTILLKRVDFAQSLCYNIITEERKTPQTERSDHYDEADYEESMADIQNARR